MEWRLTLTPVRHLRVLRRWRFSCEGWYPANRTPSFVRPDERLFSSEDQARTAGAAEIARLMGKELRSASRRG